MQKKYKKDGLVAISVSLDDPSDKDTEKNVLAFLKKQRAEFTNLILNAKLEEWQGKLKFDGPPAVFVFHRGGKYERFVAGEPYDKIEKRVVELLKEKPLPEPSPPRGRGQGEGAKGK